MDEADAYLKRVNSVKRKEFSKGYVAAKKDTIEVVNVSNTPNRAPALPLKRKKRNRSVSPAEGTDDTKTNQKNTQEQATGCSTVATPPGLAAGKKTVVSLFDKWFPLNSLKKATIEVAQSPPTAFVETIIEEFTALRLRIISMRSAAEDLQTFLEEQSLDHRTLKGAELRTQLKRCITQANWSEVNAMIDPLCDEPLLSRRTTVAVVERILNREQRVKAPPVYSIKRWHEFCSQYGPEGDKYPPLSLLLWLSSSSVTAFFTVFANRFLNGVKKAIEATGMTENAEGKPSPLELDERDFSNSDNEHDAKKDEEEIHSCEFLVQTQPNHSSVSEASHRHLLTFLRFLMPSQTKLEDGSVRQSAGFGVWLFTSMAALDFPFDPDTDRVAHQLFREICDQVRVLGEMKNIRGEERGRLWASLPPPRPQDGPYKSYLTVSEIGRDDLNMLYTLIVIMTKYFNQNQNRLIPL